MSQPTRHHNAPTRPNLAFAWVPLILAFFALLITATCLRTAQAETATTAEEKSTVPVPAKTVRRASQASESWSAGTTAGIGETVSYRLTATLPATLRSYDTYTLWFCDELSDGLTYQKETVAVTVVHLDGKSESVKLDVRVDGQRMRVGSDDILASIPGIAPNDTVVVEYNCMVNAKAVQGLAAGNENALTLEYRRDPTSDEIGKTSVKQITEVYSFQLDLHKVDKSDGTSLAGASFVLQNADGEYRTASQAWSKEKADAQVVATNEQGMASFAGLGAGTYTLTEAAAPKGYDLLAEPIAVKLYVTDVESNERTLTATTTSAAAKVTAVDAGTGVATVKVEDPKSTSPPEEDDGKKDTPDNPKNPDNPSNPKNPDNPSNPKNPDNPSNPNDTDSSGSSGVTGNQRTTTSSGSASPVSSFVQTVRSVLPTTADPLLVGSGAVLVVSAGLIIAGARKRRSAQRSDNTSDRE